MKCTLIGDYLIKISIERVFSFLVGNDPVQLQAQFLFISFLSKDSTPVVSRNGCKHVQEGAARALARVCSSSFLVVELLEKDQKGVYIGTAVLFPG